MYTLKAVVGISIGMILSAGIAASQGPVTQRNLSLGLAKTIAEGALAECKSKGFNTAVAVVDRAGQIMAVSYTHLTLPTIYSV